MLRPCCTVTVTVVVKHNNAVPMNKVDKNDRTAAGMVIANCTNRNFEYYTYRRKGFLGFGSETSPTYTLAPGQHKTDNNLDSNDSINYKSGKGWTSKSGRNFFVAYNRPIRNAFETDDNHIAVANFDSHYDPRGKHCRDIVSTLHNGNVPSKVQANTHNGSIGWESV